MTTRFRLLLLLPLLTLAGAGLNPAPAQVKKVWTVDCGDPTRDGKAAIAARVTYLDPLGKMHKATLKGIVQPVEKDWTGVQKRDAMAAALQAAANGQQVGGRALIQIAIGLHDTFQVVGTADHPGHFSEASVEDLQVDDSGTNEKDKVSGPGESGPMAGLAVVRLLGEVTGVDSEGQASTVTILAGSTAATLALEGRMTTEEVADTLRDRLRAAGATVWSSSEPATVYVILNDSFRGAGAGSSDLGLTTSCTVFAAP